MLENIEDSSQLVLTYNVNKTTSNVKNPPASTISVHRKKQTNTMYTINAINKLIEEKIGRVDKSYRVDWNELQNTVLVTAYGKLKVVLNYSGGFVGEKYMFLSRDLIGKQMFGILVENEEIGKNIIDIYSSKLFNWYISCEKNGGFNSGIYKLPKIDFTKKYTDDDLYDIFELSDLEKDYIKNYDI